MSAILFEVSSFKGQILCCIIIVYLDHIAEISATINAFRDDSFLICVIVTVCILLYLFSLFTCALHNLALLLLLQVLPRLLRRHPFVFLELCRNPRINSIL